MFPIPEQLSQAAKTQFETQFDILNRLASKTFEGAQKVIALNLSTTRTTVEQGSEAARRLFETRDPKEFFSTDAAKAPIDTVLAYGRELFTIASQTQAELLQTAKEQLSAARSANEAVRTAAAAAPAEARKTAQLVVEAAQPAAGKAADLVAAATASAPAAAPVEADEEVVHAKPVKAKPAAAAKAVSEAVTSIPVAAKPRK
ncbi:phasin family protein [Massilia endophytica]|uniref:phasin family protein n=1 Tax=Massilia endophytica TaxID=2899220 RepID=UPI001E3256F9|nr:phasin family protein [Massilia endophytica]UGQ45390.1 phasin family protein [Massilia endophytica]